MTKLLKEMKGVQHTLAQTVYHGFLGIPHERRLNNVHIIFEVAVSRGCR